MAKPAKAVSHRSIAPDGLFLAEVCSFCPDSGDLEIVVGSGERVSALMVAGAFAGKLPRVGDRVLVCYVADESRPIVIDVIVHDRSEPRVELEKENQHVAATMDGRQVKIRADREIRLECGKATLVLMRDGTVVIRGTKVISRASGVNKLKGGSIQIN